MRAFWNFFLSSVWLIPWLLLSIAAGFAFLRRRSSRPLLCQMLGSIGTLLLTFLRSLVLSLLTMTQAPARAVAATTIICNFLIFMALLLFAAGYGWEKIVKRRGA